MKRRGVFSTIEKFFRKHRERRYLYRALLADEYFFSLSTTRLMSSRGIIENCDIRAESPQSSSLAEKYVRSIPEQFDQVAMDRDFVSLYLCTDSVPFFINEVLGKIQRPFVLVTGDSDLTVSESTIQKIEALLSNTYLRKWFAQNLNYVHAKVEPMPIGLDYHSAWQNPRHYSGQHILPAHQEGELRSICRAAKKFSEREPLVVCDWIGHSTYGDREEARRGIPADARFVPPRRLPRHELWQEYAKYAFVASPSGLGMDCHRTWEALVLGCVPIIKRSPMSKLFEDLPVLIVDDWKMLTVEGLREHQIEMTKKTYDYSKFLLDYWFCSIRGEKPCIGYRFELDDMSIVI